MQQFCREGIIVHKLETSIFAVYILETLNWLMGAIVNKETAANCRALAAIGAFAFPSGIWYRPRSFCNITGSFGVISGGHRDVWSSWSLATSTTDHTETLMTKTAMDLSELPAKSDQTDLLRSLAEAFYRRIQKSYVNGLIGTRRHEPKGDRDRPLGSRLGTLNLRVMKLLPGSYVPGFLEARKTSEQALVVAIEEAYIGGVPTCRVDDPV
jgi:hypothetical protein